MESLNLPLTTEKFSLPASKGLAVLLVVAVTVQFSLIGWRYLPVQAKETPVSIEKTLIELTNAERQGHGLSTLTYNPQLSQAAQAKAADMLANGYFDHYSPSGKTPWSFIKTTGYDYLKAGENLAINFATATDAVPAWMASPTHRANILKADYEEIGIATVTGQFQGRQTTLIVQMFGTRQFSAKQLVDTVLPL